MPPQTPESILQRLDWQVIRRLDGMLQGDYRSLFWGFGLDLADIREYQFGDDVRSIDWNVTARMDTPYVRQFYEDREITAWFLLDLSPSMDFGSVQQIKRSTLIDFTAVMTRLLTRHGNRVGAILYNAGVERMIPPHSGRNQVLLMIHELLKQPHRKHAPTTDLSSLLISAFNTIRRRSLVFLVSDFFSVAGWERPLGLLNQQHEVLAIRLYDPREQEIPEIGTVWLEDAETGEQVLVDTTDRHFRKRFSQAALARDVALKDAFKRTRVDTLSLSTTDDLVKILVNFTYLRKQRRIHTKMMSGVQL
ncbi:MAG TPA: DUF58 domain-containing protein [Anaerolineaceae bacterium]